MKERQVSLGAVPGVQVRCHPSGKTGPRLWVCIPSVPGLAQAHSTWRGGLISSSHKQFPNSGAAQPVPTHSWIRPPEDLPIPEANPPFPRVGLGPHLLLPRSQDSPRRPTHSPTGRTRSPPAGEARSAPAPPSSLAHACCPPPPFRRCARSRAPAVPGRRATRLTQLPDSTPWAVRPA